VQRRPAGAGPARRPPQRSGCRDSDGSPRHRRCCGRRSSRLPLRPRATPCGAIPRAAARRATIFTMLLMVVLLLLLLLLSPLGATTAAPPPPPPHDYSCAGHCGSWAERCWCNDECSSHNDCCADYQAQCGGGGGGGGGGNVSTRYITVGGLNRSYELQVPSANLSGTSTNWSSRLPIVLVFHGDGGTAARQAADDQFRRVAGQYALVVHGQGIGTEQYSGKAHPTWNGGGSSMQSIGPHPHRIAPDGETCQQNITKGTLFASCARQIGTGATADPCWWSNCLDDVAYVVAILDELQAEFPVDVAKVFASGDSNGAMFLYQLVADPRTGHRLAAVAPVAGLPHNGFLFPPANPSIRFLNIWGTEDTYIPALCPQRPPRDKSGPGCCGWFYSCIDNTTRTFARGHGFSPTAAPHALSAAVPSSVHCRGYSTYGSNALSMAQVADCSWPGPHGWPHMHDIGSRWVQTPRHDDPIDIGIGVTKHRHTSSARGETTPGFSDCTDAMARACADARRASIGSCYVCLGQHQSALHRADCNSSSLSAWCTAPPAPPTVGPDWAAETIMAFFLQGQAPPPLPPPVAHCPMCGEYNCDGWIASDPGRYTCAELKRDWNCDCQGCRSCPNVTADV
jgi:poly(3-hydroxybutyrate) depolymerase